MYIQNLKVKDDPEAEVQDDGTITLKSEINNLKLTFDDVENVKSVKLEVTKTDDLVNNNLSLTEIIPNF